jgi:hypothetical protein
LMDFIPVFPLISDITEPNKLNAFEH